MEKRFNLEKIAPEAIKAMYALEKYLHATELNPIHKELIKIRASQLNGCAYCINMHTKDARKLGETEQRIYLLNAWREVDFYTGEERAVLALTEEVTLISNHGVSDATYQNAVRLLGEAYTAQVLMAIVTINAWNRIGVSTQLKPAQD